ncbi:MAG TPA: EamA family transporter [Anaerolineales bacterium]|nr:EamA family transporter [Anaerolineales bacterium]
MAIKQPYRLAVIEAVIVNLLWASTFIFVKISLREMGPLTIGGLRYFLGFLVLVPFLLKSKKRKRISNKEWRNLAIIGISSYTLANNAMFWSLIYLPATTVSFMMGLITLLVFISGVIWLKELPNRLQFSGILLTLIGTGMFFSVGLKPGEPLGILLAGGSLICFTIFGVMGRNTARARSVDTLSLTAFPLAIGGGLSLLIAIPIEGFPHASIQTWGLIAWLAVVNTSLAYMLYNHSLQILTAFQMNVLLNLAPIGTAVLGWFLLGEQLNLLQFIGIVVVIVGASLVQVRNSSEKLKEEIVVP